MKLLDVSRGKTNRTPLYFSSNPKYDRLVEGKPVEDVLHVTRCISSSGDISYGACSGVLNPAQIFQPGASVECAAVVKMSCGKRVAVEVNEVVQSWHSWK